LADIVSTRTRTARNTERSDSRKENDCDDRLECIGIVLDWVLSKVEKVSSWVLIRKSFSSKNIEFFRPKMACNSPCTPHTRLISCHCISFSSLQGIAFSSHWELHEAIGKVMDHSPMETLSTIFEHEMESLERVSYDNSDDYQWAKHLPSSFPALVLTDWDVPLRWNTLSFLVEFPILMLFKYFAKLRLLWIVTFLKPAKV
jgi:hypothetical protein